MAGIRMRVRSIAAEILDTFEGASRALAGSVTTYGSKTWAKVGTDTTVATINSGVVKATSGTNNVAYTIDTGGANFDVGFTVSAVRAPSAIASMVWRVSDINNNYSVVLRTDTNTPQYAIASRSGGVFTFLLSTGVVPAIGDKVLVSTLNHVTTLTVNGVVLGQVTLSAYGQYFKAGLNFNGSDLTTSFDNFAVYPR